MASPHSSLASLLAYPNASNPSGDMDDQPGAVAQSEMLEYLRDNYADGTNGTSTRQHRNPDPPVFEHSAIVSLERRPRRTPSPVDPSITIPPALAELASTSQGTHIAGETNPIEITDREYPPDDNEERGEMGGKRRKPLHERAGWAEMDAQPARKRGRRRRASSGFAEEFVGYAGLGNGVGSLEGDLIQAQREMGIEVGLPVPDGLLDPQLIRQDDAADVSGGTDGEGGGKRAKPMNETQSKESRAEQNRRAQQAFRRRREEHIKKLETDAAALEPTRRKLVAAESMLREVALSLEASKIENAALRAALRTTATSSGTSVLTPDGTLVVNASSAKRETPSKGDEIEAAYGILERQARQLAKQNRKKRGE